MYYISPAYSADIDSVIYMPFEDDLTIYHDVIGSPMTVTRQSGAPFAYVFLLFYRSILGVLVWFFLRF
jgi:hypothetical protein